MSERGGLRLVWRAEPPRGEEPPPGVLIDGRDVEWGEWHVAPAVHDQPTICRPCGYTGAPWTAFGTVPAPPGAMVRVPVEDPAGGQARAAFVEPAPAVARAVAYRCPRCFGDEVYDMLDDLTGWNVILESGGQGRLF
jgi:hypothetical protein